MGLPISLSAYMGLWAYEPMGLLGLWAYGRAYWAYWAYGLWAMGHGPI